jgi:tetraacyldisaccharide 4'-kinase
VPLEPGWWYRRPGLVSAALSPVSRVYGYMAERRFSARDGHRAMVPVICVGNFTAGGTGKTPVTAMIAVELQARGEQPVILTRGYGGRLRGPHWVDPSLDRAGDVGDEPLMLARMVPVVVARDREAGAKAIEASGRVSVIVMDDGLQNPSVIKDLVVAVVDGSRGLGNGCVIPGGPLRARMADQGPRADLMVVNGEPREGLVEGLSRWCRAPCVSGRLVGGDGLEWLRGCRVFGFAGIGHPQRFFDTLKTLGAVVVGSRAFADHAPYRAIDAAALMASAQQQNARLVTTEKDFVRLSGYAELAALRAASTPIPVTMVLGERDLVTLEQRLDEVMTRKVRVAR